MLAFRLFYENSWEITPDSIYLSPKTIYNFYFLYTYLQTIGTDEYSGYLIKEFSQNIKKTYLRVFSNLLKKQLQKYQSRRRVDKDFEMSDNPTPTELHTLMSKTFRSDMNRRNDRWIDLAKWVVELEKANSPKDIFFAIDRINNTTHNTQENILSKFQNSDSLMSAFDYAHRVTNLNQFKPYISKDYADLL